MPDSLSPFRLIAFAALQRGEGRILPIAVGGKQPLIAWKGTSLDVTAEADWNAYAPKWIEGVTLHFPNANVAVIAKPFEKLFIDEDQSAEFRASYEAWSGEKFPNTYTTSARENRKQSHWLQTDRTRAMGNIAQGSTTADISVRQNNLYVLAEGSRHKNGTDFYKSVGGPDILPMPDKLVDFLEHIRIKAAPGDKVELVRDASGLVPHGSIHNYMLTEAGRLRNLGLSAEAIYPALSELVHKNCAPPIDEDRIKMMAESVCSFPEGQPPIVFNQKPDAAPAPVEAAPFCKMTQSEANEELEKEFPVLPLGEKAGPYWDDDIMYGIAGDIVRKASQYCEAHPAGMYLDLLVSLGSIIGRGPYFNVQQTRHYTNEFMARVGDTADSRKGTGRDAIDDVLKFVDNTWYTNRVMAGFGSAESIVNELRDPMPQKVVDKKAPGGFRELLVPGVDDKRLCIREGELASVFQLASKNESRADIVLRDGWDSKRLSNLVKGKSKDGLSNSTSCQEPHISISGDTTRAELLRKMPAGAAENGFGNRFLYCYVFRTKLCPNGGPFLDWLEEVKKIHHAIQQARELKYVPLMPSAAKVWNRMYFELSEPQNQLLGQAGDMTKRAAPHIRRLALILALLDEMDAVHTKHLHAAKKLWDYCQESARYIFTGTTKERDEIVKFLNTNGPATPAQIRRDVFHDHKKAEWVKAQIDALCLDPKSGVSMKDGLVIK